MPDLALIQILINGLQNKEACNIRTLLRSLRSEISPLIDEQRISRIFYGNPKYFVRIPRMSEGSFWRLQSKGAQTKSALKSLAQHTRLQEGENKGRRLTTQPISANKTPNPLLKTSSELEKPSFPKTGAAKIQPLLAWQFEALKAWRDNSQVGIIEAVTGSGKTRVAIEAIAETVKSTDTYSLVIVPTLTLAHQWHDRVSAARIVDGNGIVIKVGCVCGGRVDSFDDFRVLIATASSASQRLLQPPHSNGRGSLLIADEVHHLGAPEWAKALQPRFSARLGLTATLERNDEGVEKFIHPYFQKTIFTLGLERAIQDKIVAQYHTIFIGVRLNTTEQFEYTQATEKIRHSLRAIKASRLVDMDIFGTMIKQVQKNALMPSSPIYRAAKQFLSAFSARRSILACASNKPRRVAELAIALKRGKGTIIFSETLQAAAKALIPLKKVGLGVALIASETPCSDRESILAAFSSGKTNVLAAPRVLDEGVDVPEADVGIILASSRSRRQFIQRLGRIIRRKPDGRPAHLFVLYVEGTREDPRSDERTLLVSEIEKFALTTTIVRADDLVPIEVLDRVGRLIN